MVGDVRGGTQHVPYMECTNICGNFFFLIFILFLIVFSFSVSDSVYFRIEGEAMDLTVLKTESFSKKYCSF